MTDKELLEKYQINLCKFDGSKLACKGFYEPTFRVIYINDRLDDTQAHKVILHELGHITHNPCHYDRLLYQYENQADRFMIRHLLQEELASYDIIDFNWLQFAQRHHISTTWGQEMIQDEFRKLVGRY